MVIDVGSSNTTTPVSNIISYLVCGFFPLKWLVQWGQRNTKKRREKTKSHLGKQINNA